MAFLSLFGFAIAMFFRYQFCHGEYDIFASIMYDSDLTGPIMSHH